MIDEITSQIALEKERMKYTILAGNVQLWQMLFKDENKDEPNDEEIEWIRPESAEDIDRILSVLNAMNVDSERPNQQG